MPSGDAGPGEGEADAGRMLQILWRGKWILLLVPLLGFGATKFWLDSQVPLYTAAAQVQVDARAVSIMKSGAGEAINKPRTVLKQQQGLFKSTTLLKQIADSPSLAGMKTFAPERLGGQTILGALYEGLQTSIDVDSDRLFVTFVAPYREEAVVVVDEALRVYIDYHKAKKREEAEQLAAIVRREWESAKAELAATSREIDDLKAENTLLGGTERTPLQDKLQAANTALTAAHLDTQRQWAVFQEMSDSAADPARFRERALYWRGTRPIAALEERIAVLQKEREEKGGELERKQKALGPDNPVLAGLQRELEDLRRQEDEVVQQYAVEYLRNSEVEYQRAKLLERSLSADVDQLLSKVAEQNAVLSRITDLTVARDQLRARVAGFDERITQLELENQTGALNLDVIEYARAANRPSWPEIEKTYTYALGGSGILAFALVLLLGLSDRRVRNVEDIPRLLGTSVLGVLPELPGGRKRSRTGRMAEEQPHSLVAEGIRSTRTAAIFALPGGCGVVALTSANAAEGKSVCASNLAFSLARAGKRTLLIDADMRRPTQHEIYEVPNGTGLAGLLDSSAPVKKAVVPNVAAGLDLIPAGEPRGRAAELCEGRALVELIRSLRETYECIVIDTPPVLDTSEARVLAAMADAVVFVLRLEKSRAPNLKRALGILRGVGARVLGALPNGASSSRGARAYTGGISLGDGSAARGTSARAPSEQAADAGVEGRAGGRGTDFLGLEEESA